LRARLEHVVRRPHRARPAGPAAGLGRTDTERTRTPSVGSSRSLRSGQAESRALFTFACSPSHPLARREPVPASSKAGGSLRAIPPFGSSRIASRPGRPVPHCEKDASHRLLQPTLDTSTPSAARFPTAPPIRPRSLSTSRPSGLRRSTGAGRARLAPLSIRRPTNHRVELRLTANLQLQRRHNPSNDLPEPKPERPPDSSTARCRWGPRSKAPSRRASRPRLFRPRAEHEALPLTPSVTTTRRARPLDRSRAGSRQAALPPPSRQRRPLRGNQDAFLRRVLSPPRPARSGRAACAARRSPPAEACASLLADRRLRGIILRASACASAPTRHPLALPPARGTGSSRARHRARGFATARRLPASLSPATPSPDVSGARATG